MRWYACAQSLLLHLQSEGRVHAFGGIPQTYGFGTLDTDGSVYVVVNPAQGFAKISLPLLSPLQKPLSQRQIFRDAGFVPRLTGKTIGRSRCMACKA